MDTITQGLLGAVTAQLGFRSRLGKAAPWVGAAAGVLPDLDVFVLPVLRAAGVEVNAFDFLRYHRGFTHGLLSIGLQALLVAAVWWAFRRKDFPWLLACAGAASLSHPLLDVCTVYGTQLLAPLSQERFALDCAPIVDLIYTGVLIATLIGAGVTRRLKRGGERAATIVACVGFAVSTTYLAGGRVLHDVAVERALAAFRAGRPAGSAYAVTADAYPALGSIFVWRVVVRTEDQWHVGRTHCLFDRPIRLRMVEDVDNPLVRLAAEQRDVRTFRWFARGQLRPARSIVDGRTVVDFHDMRYGLASESPDSLWLARVSFDDAGAVSSVQYVRNYQNGADVADVIGAAWRELFRP